MFWFSVFVLSSWGVFGGLDPISLKENLRNDSATMEFYQDRLGIYQQKVDVRQKRQIGHFGDAQTGWS